MSDETLEQRLRALAATPEDGDWEDVLQRAGQRFSMRRSWPRLVLVAAVVAVAALVAVLVTHGSNGTSSAGPIGSTGTTGATGPTGPPGPVAGPTGLAHPLLGGQRVSLSDAEIPFGGSLVLPDTAQVTPSDVGAVWLWLVPAVDGPTMRAGQAVTAAAVTFPSQGLMIRYFRKSDFPDTFAFFRSMAKNAPGSQVISLSGTPALLVPQGLQGASWGMITFVLRGNQIEVMGHVDEAVLQDVAQSMVDRASN